MNKPVFPTMLWEPSPHFDQRPDPEDISLLVIHNISLPPGKFGSGDVTRFFLGKLDHSADPFYQQIEGVRVSAHCFIDRHGKVTQYVDFANRAWHAGVSSFQGRVRCNDFSIGIEMEGTDTQPYTDQQYHSLVDLTHYLLVRYPNLSLGRIVGHSDIAPRRKTDPGVSFDWCRYRRSLRE